MKSNETDRPVYLFDTAGHTYRFANTQEILHRRVDARTCSGMAASQGRAPAEIARHQSNREKPEVGGRHLDPQSEFYHTDWQWGDLEFDGQNGLTGSFFCCHAHYSPVDARAFYDPSCDMLPVAAGDVDPSVDEFVVQF